jgi:hypothetical protein
MGCPGPPLARPPARPGPPAASYRVAARGSRPFAARRWPAREWARPPGLGHCGTSLGPRPAIAREWARPVDPRQPAPAPPRADPPGAERPGPGPTAPAPTARPQGPASTAPAPTARPQRAPPQRAPAPTGPAPSAPAPSAPAPSAPAPTAPGPTVPKRLVPRPADRSRRRPPRSLRPAARPFREARARRPRRVQRSPRYGLCDLPNPIHWHRPRDVGIRQYSCNQAYQRIIIPQSSWRKRGGGHEKCRSGWSAARWKIDLLLTLGG